MSALLFALLAPAARAESVIEFKTTVPVAIFVDDQQAILGSNMKQKAVGLEPGVHQLRVAGMFGKTLYEAEIDIPDGTITRAEWDHGEIKVIDTDWLTDEDEEVVEAPVPVEEPATEVPAVAAEVPVEAPLAVPVVEAPVVEAPVVEATALASVQRPRTLTVQATDGMRIDVLHEGRKLTIVVEGDTFRIEDSSGAVVALGME